MMPLYDPIYGVSGQPVLQYTPAITPVQPASPQPAVQQAPFVRIVTVNGESAAKSMRLAPGSTLLASDESESIIWFIKANDVGPNTVYKIAFDPAIFSGGSGQSVDLSAFENRLASIEERLSRYESNVSADKQRTGNGSNSHR